jgi:sugar diacid utilization regulator
MTTRLRRTLQTVTRQNDLLRRAAAMDETLTGLVLAGGSLAQIAGAVADLADKPCEIYDAADRRLASAAPTPLEDAPDTPVLDATVRAHPAVRQALESLGAKGSGVIGPIAEAGLAHRCLYAPITTRDDLWGSLVIVERGSRFGPLDPHIARRAATNVALELAAERRAARAEWDARASLAGELIRGSSDVGPLRRRAQYLGVDLGAPHVACIVGAQRDGAVPSVAEVAGAFAARGHQVLGTAVAEGILVIVALDADAPPLVAVARMRDVVGEVLGDLAPGGAAVAAIASRCTDAADFVRAYAEARQVLSCVRAFARPDRPLILTADDLGPGRLFLASSSRREAERFADDALGVLLRSDDETRGDLLRTLEVYFDTSRSVRRAAQELDVHENTIRYRLARIRELTGLAVGADSSDELTAHLALLVLRLRRLAGDPELPAADPD